MRSGSGDLTGNGFIRIDGFDLGELAFDVKARQFMLSDTRDARLVVSFDSKLAGTVSRPELTGSMIVNNASIYLDNFGERTVEDVQLEGDEPLQTPSMYDSLSIRMRVQVDPNVWMRNRTSPELAIELQGDMDLLKDRNSDLMAFGSLGTRQGYAMQYGKRFQLERGQLSFSGDPLNPGLDIVSLYKLKVPEDIEIRYLIGGTVNGPTFKFRSNPEMELENIISYTLFGKPFGALFSWQQSFSGGRGGSALARDAAIGVLVDRVESLATESLGIDVLQIDSNRLGETVTTSVKAGKYITDKLFVAVLNELGGSDAVTRVVIEYYIRRNLLLMVTQGNDRRSGVDLLWKYEY
jgi:autotransporter translocation and assembly factor TamB